MPDRSPAVRSKENVVRVSVNASSREAMRTVPSRSSTVNVAPGGADGEGLTLGLIEGLRDTLRDGLTDGDTDGEADPTETGALSSAHETSIWSPSAINENRRLPQFVIAERSSVVRSNVRV